MPRTYGYARVSTDQQTTALQLDALNRAGVDHIYQDEGISGSHTKRPSLQRLLRKVEEGDTIVIWRLDRLGRSLTDLVSMVDGFGKRGIHLKSLCEQIDTSTASGKLIFHVMAAMAQFERDLIIERTRAGLAAARARGVKTGPKPKLSSSQLSPARKMLESGERVEDVAELLSISRITLWRALRKPLAMHA